MVRTFTRIARMAGALSCAAALLGLAACSGGSDDGGAAKPTTAAGAASGAPVAASASPGSAGSGGAQAAAPTTPVWGFTRFTSPATPVGTQTVLPASESSGSWRTGGGSAASAHVMVTHLARGSYQVTFPGVAVPSGRGVAFATALDAPGAAASAPVVSCRTVRWDAAARDEQVEVACRDAAGTPADTGFTALFDHVPDAAAPSPGGAFAYLRVDAAGAAAATSKPVDSYSVAGPGTIEVHRVGAGHYTIDLIGPAFAKNGNNLQVNATGEGEIGCNALGRVVGKDRQSVFVGCARGATWTDSPFALLYTSGHALIPTDATSFGHAFTGITVQGGPTQQAPIGPAVNAWGWYSANSTGATNQVRRLAVGRYEVTFPSVARNADSLQVTPYGEPTARCSAAGAGATAAASTGGAATITVRCVDAAGRPADSYASVAYVSAPGSTTP
ncbi:conserved exported hypothetical protein [Frankia canadensis]|uniref:Uncharacterized protein n=1 Tax=Frankia canadensis TaxID=1836972 RepID=A0A2I2KUN3_9ACTN|nr:hypothetical protein [Frankia canadensis]SNQ49371.1 conserved exported hypothetical protein [Frankia canadensis]SOU56661.1 conserved exported hypothetical protein [Frankia canadensis]